MAIDATVSLLLFRCFSRFGWVPPNGSRLVVGGGRGGPGNKFPELRPGDVSLNDNSGGPANPHIEGDIRTIDPGTLGKYNEVVFERIPYDVIDAQALSNSAAVLNPGGRISIITGRGVNTAALQANLEAAGFTNVQVRLVGTGEEAFVTATGTLGGR
jgi:hypothetical protein